MKSATEFRLDQMFGSGEAIDARRFASPPHPGPLPRGEREHGGIARGAGSALSVIKPTHPGVCSFSPSGGEGWDEGGAAQPRIASEETPESRSIPADQDEETNGDWLEVVVRRQWMAARDIKAIELAAPDGRTLPAAAAGAHVDLHLPNGITRQYSIIDAGAGWYRIGVLRDAESRGGSSYVVDTLAEGDRLSIGAPRNHFALDETAADYVLIAGGIGITPMVAMARRLVALGKPPQLHYLVRHRERAVFLAELETMLPAGALHLHDAAEGGVADLEAIVGPAEAGRQLYACGPAGLLDAIRELSVGWPAGSVRFEQFRNASAAAPAEAARECTIELRRSGIRFTLGANETLLEALERHDIDLPCCCREGVCGTCAVDVLEGEVEHRDALQSDEEKALGDLMYVCVSRPRGPRLVLDL